MFILCQVIWITFILLQDWKLDKLYVGQYEYATFEENGHTFEFTNEFDEDDEWY